MSYCMECGLKLPEGAKFCHKCGAPVANSDGQMDKDRNESKTMIRPNESNYGAVNLKQLSKDYIIDDRYEIKEKLGQGGFGAVYRAYDKKMNSEKALKVLPEAIINDIEAMSDLLNEAKTMIALNHKHIIRVYDLHDEGKIQYIDMEYIDGKTLTEIKLEHSNKQVPEDKVREYALQIADGLAYAHSNNIIHKDIKPQNIMVNSHGQVKIMDFGIAETVRTSMSRIANSTSSGTLVYMSPEQIRGKNLGKEADIYSFGAMLYELLSGHPPFYKGAIEHQIINKTPKEIGNVSSKMNHILMVCLSKDYSSRYSSFNHLIKLLNEKKTVRGDELKTLKVKKEVTLSTIPDKAKVKINGQIVDKKTPFKIKMKFGKHNISISKDGYYDFEKDFVVKNDKKNTYKFKLEQKNKDYLNFISDKFAFVKGGTFNMGDLYDIGNEDEKPVHTVKVNDFYIGKYQVTQKLWSDIMDFNPSMFKDNKKPVHNITWYDAIIFCNKLSEKHGLKKCYEIKGNEVKWVSRNNGYRLPTEAEWEYVAIGGIKYSKHKFSGSDNLDNVAIYRENKGEISNIGIKDSNSLGIYDINGNVWEWCWDYYKNHYYSSTKNNPTGPLSGDLRVIRGGGWFSLKTECRNTTRGRYDPNKNSNDIGIRIAKSK